jgi:16S rRNA (guanine527-N7)-methyltransferase
VLIDVKQTLSKTYHITEQQLHLLEEYVKLLLTWQEHTNLIGKNTVDNLWERHILDSVQLLPYIKQQGLNIADVGTGAGLPGLVLSICNPENTYFLIEATSKKTNFLSEVKQRLNLLNIHIINKRLEDITDIPAIDVLMSRAVTSLASLMLISKNLLNKNTKCLFLKGRSYQFEINEFMSNPRNKKKYNLVTYQSVTSTESMILEINKNN